MGLPIFEKAEINDTVYILALGTQPTVSSKATLEIQCCFVLSQQRTQDLV